ncbi:Asp-tRNA(Asn)/Glu-tRNA(Gln) amidotransferase subunit GatB [Parvicella tangerina]|uniref:Aspartyl/glutamyl-tRNA(Asn/Gln) amidotransferase subunit B n=1 Tax=Parvicella tangerina TaxID=2829795 RepID=A0A916JKN4_9FLAO|nr:Asp-tRNA(Asn)/Glu-tRNA(Gln) amidotransferase subunit GatB [Parvicella tangerina]CAG5077977.1 Aspartyl/glutamyl-tRNA(Asn/Gln) amidotransferase subunit B [Parvicella tangerina]
MTLEEALSKYTPVIGLEVHAQLNTKSKAYSSDPNEFGSTPNTNVSPISLGHPGTLPRLNKEVVNSAIKLGLACQCDITREMHFDRKNYFYADLPKGYQITQDKTPICRGGRILIKDAQGNEKGIELTRIHMEEDSGKSMHDQDPFDTLIDLNRAGVPLLEMVTEPVIKDSTEAYNYLTEVRKLLRYLDVCDGNMEEGSMRCDVNISIMPKGSTEFGKRCEVKNLNSIRNVQRAIDSEIIRHAEILDKGGEVDVETRNFDAVTGTTTGLRSKEAAHDYRYFPEPDLGGITITQGYIDQIESSLPALPNDLYKKYINDLGLSDYDASNIVDSKAIALYFEEIIQHTKNYKSAANWVMGSVKSYLNQNAIEIDSFPISAQHIALLINLIDGGKINNGIATQKVFPAMLEKPNLTPEQIAADNNWIVQDNSDELESIIKGIFESNPSETARFKDGEKKLTGFFMGLVMRETKGTADPKTTAQLLNKIVNTI